MEQKSYKNIGFKTPYPNSNTGTFLLRYYLMLKRPVYSFTSLVIYLYAHANDTVKFELCMYDTFLHRKDH